MSKPKQKVVELTQIEIHILSALGEISNRLEDIVKGCRRKLCENSLEFIENSIKMMWRAAEIYNFCYSKFGYFSREDLKSYLSDYMERMEINEAWESLEDIEELWNDFIESTSKSLELNESHQDKFIKYYFINTLQLYNLEDQQYNEYKSIFTRLSLVIMFPIYIPGTILSNFLEQISEIEKELYVLGMDLDVILFGSIKKTKIWAKQYKINCENLYVDTSDEILKARRNLPSIFSIKSMESIGLSSKQKMKFLIPEDINWKENLFPGALAIVGGYDGTVYFDHLCDYIGEFPNNNQLLDQMQLVFGKINHISRGEVDSYLKDGMRYYIAPDFSQMRLETQSGFYYDARTTLYYEPKSGYFYDGQRGVYLYWCKDNKSYLPVESYEGDNNNQVNSTIQYKSEAVQNIEATCAALFGSYSEDSSQKTEELIEHKRGGVYNTTEENNSIKINLTAENVDKENSHESEESSKTDLQDVIKSQDSITEENVNQESNLTVQSIDNQERNDKEIQENDYEPESKKART